MRINDMGKNMKPEGTYETKKAKKDNRGRVLLLISLIIGVAYAIYSFNYWGGLLLTAEDGTEVAGFAIASALTGPHVIVTAIAVIFNALAFFMRSRPFALVSGILYSVAMILFPMYAVFVIAEAVLCYIAFARMKTYG